ncbi:MAG: acyl-ACP--UDP-N-acetylglucosamine O-acyltransferase [Pseudomonadota bacterium]|nr:acyl-ACP--UDP-N-acetylglucosamine O-acyltransferase [Pseudomonadota bacterium]
MSSGRLHPTALIDPKAELADDVEVGPYAVIEAGARIDSGTTIGAYTRICGDTRIGRDNRIHSHCSLGEVPQDKKYGGETTRLEIGDRNLIREFCTFNRGTADDLGVTRLGNDNWIMAYVHIAHDCQIGDHTIFANNAQLAGHVHVGDYAILGGFTGVHQFVHIGAHSFTAIATILVHDLPPYVMAAGDTARPYGINTEGLRRRGYSAAALAAIKRAYKTLYKSGLTLDQARVHLAEQARTCAEIGLLADFLQSSTRGIVR